MTFDISSINIPKHPGIYLMKDANYNIIYIGKAKNLKNRVKSYFLQNQNYKTQKLVEKICDIEFVLTDNEGEAYILESNMIKRYRPTYNIELKDQQRYTYLRLTDGTLRKAFKIRICKTLPKKACLEYHLGNCEAPCEFKYAQKKYSDHVSDLELILKGKKQLQEFAQKLQNDMKQASDSLDFERAKEIRDTLHRLGSLQTRQKMEYVENAPDEDYFGVKIEEHTALVMSLRQTHGVIRDSNRFSFDLIGDNTFGNFLYQYYTTSPIPKNIIVSNMPENKQVLENALSEKAGFEVKILVPKKGKRKEMISLVMKNINLIQSKGIEPGIYELQERLELENAPKIIECFDISNHGAQYAVGSMSRFVDGKPDKSGYRKFKIKTVSGRDDYAMIAEIVKRRYYRLVEENSELPNLVLIDGGKGQLNAAERSLQSISVKVQCASLAKQNEEVFVPKRKNPIIIPRSSSALKILQHARDEAHRFGVTYNRNLRKLN